MDLSNIIEKWDTVAYIAYNQLAKLIFILKYPKYGNKLKKNLKLKGKHNGQRCFIVLNGPSIKQYDLSKIATEIVFCSNYFYKGEYVDIVKPDYYCVTDSAYFSKGNEQHLEKTLQKCAYSNFLFNIKYLDIRQGHNEKNIYVTYAKHIPHALSIRNDISRMSSGFTNIALYAINIAIYMGIKEIYLLGLDFNWERGGFVHFYPDSDIEKRAKTEFEKSSEKKSACGDYWYYTQAQYQFYYMQNYAQKRGVSIFNLNPESSVRAFPFGDYKKIVGDYS